MKPVEPIGIEGWHARLRLGFDGAGGRTRLHRREHLGPLVMQRPLYPEGGAVCQAIVVHPPGGVAGGDSLEIVVEAAGGAHAQLTTPGATKWYRGFGRPASQRVSQRVGGGGTCEWLPQENIVFDGATARMTLEVEIDEGGAYCGWEIVCLGRTAGEKPFVDGALRQKLNVTVAGRLLLFESAVLDADDRLLAARTSLGDATAFGTMLAVGPTMRPDVLEDARAAARRHAGTAVTVVDGALIARWVGVQAEGAKAAFIDIWKVLRPWYCGRQAVVPRIWAT
ncbi:MAG TPA: urease accessory protein UreD [Burkholderiales bacterium]|nr:urease accessory protein UreD [Burkholderiales bacterium]